jgi:ABC-type nickel/cobalt efflux system permease component RcnA
MFGLDETIAGLGGGGLLVSLGVALLLGLRHATDPDHLTAVSTLVMSERRARAATLGLAWGLGHATTLLLVGLPVVLVGRSLPGPAQHALELAIGLIIIGLAVRLLVRWRRGYFHMHVHSHGEVRHAHPHMHEGAHTHEHSHAHDIGRSPLASFGIGLVHGAGGSAGVGVLIVAAMPGAGERVAALVVLALGTALSMALVSGAFGFALGRGPLLRRFERLAPALGVASLVFGVWYALAAVQAVPYAF